MDDKIRSLISKETDTVFFSEFLENLGNQFVAWIDIMGVQDALANKQEMPAVLRGELLACVYQHIRDDGVEVFTVGDGVVIMTDDESYLEDFLSALHYHYAVFNINRWENDEWGMHLHRFIRSGVGSGRAYRIDVDAHDSHDYTDAEFPSEFDNTPFGPGPIEAFTAEGGSPLSIQKSSGDEIEWWKQSPFDLSDDQRDSLLKLLSKYFEWYEARDKYGYKPYEAEHDRLAEEFFDAASLDGTYFDR